MQVVDDDLFEILNIPNAADERARVDLAAAITLEIRGRSLTQVAAAALLGVSQRDIAAIMNAHIDAFSRGKLEVLLQVLRPQSS